MRTKPRRRTRTIRSKRTGTLRLSLMIATKVSIVKLLDVNGCDEVRGGEGGVCTNKYQKLHLRATNNPSERPNRDEKETDKQSE
jgi:hypothetical protein